MGMLIALVVDWWICYLHYHVARELLFHTSVKQCTVMNHGAPTILSILWLHSLVNHTNWFRQTWQGLKTVGAFGQKQSAGVVLNGVRVLMDVCLCCDGKWSRLPFWKVPSVVCCSDTAPSSSPPPLSSSPLQPFCSTELLIVAFRIGFVYFDF